MPLRKRMARANGHDMPQIFIRLVGLALLFVSLTATASDGLAGKVFCGYQGWFRCEGDGSRTGWSHYAAGGKKFEPGHAHIEMWPDMSELGADERFATPFRFADGKPAEVFSSVNKATVMRHFEWMRDYAIDGVFVQRFATVTRDKRFRTAMDQVLGNCAAAAQATGRQWSLMYDLSGIKAGETHLVIEDWKRLINEHRVARDGSDAAYLKHRQKPLIALWGLGFNDRAPMLDEWAALLAFFRSDAQYGGYAIMIGVPYHWRTLHRDSIADGRLHQLIAQCDVVSPWAVGRLATPQDAANRVDSVLKPDITWCNEHRLDYLPVIFPGFSWSNLSKSRGVEAKFDAIPRRGGEFLWSQALAAKKAGAKGLYVAMFDEMDEGTAIFKTSQQPPIGESKFLTEPSLPSDHYLWLTGILGKMMRGELPASETLPARK